ncbi:outer membrane protein assembly factor BamB family protein [Brachybacterium tyrofermentans]|uniref:outer membrane protein assembly factor BamB family protein n=1 Tax=Brachybacterium tyrofermentans TaxID=47848 RepID=UPI003FCF4A11
MVAGLILGAARPEWVARAWDSTGIDCGRGLSQGDPHNAGSLSSSWGEATHQPDDELDLDEHRAHVEELARQLGYEPVREIPGDARISSEEGRSVEVDADAQGGLIRVDSRGEEGLHRIAAIDPSTGVPAWNWDLDGGRDTAVYEHGDHLILANRIVRGGFFEGDRWTDLLSLDARTGARQGCQRFEGFPGYGAGSTDAALVVGTESWNPMGDDEDQEVGERAIQQVTVPGFKQGFSRTLPALDDETGDDGMDRSRPQPLVTLQGGFFLTYTSPFVGGSGDAFSLGRSGADFPSDQVPIEAFSMDTGEPLWSYGDPGDRIAVVSGVSGISGASGVLVAELGEFEPSAKDPEHGSSAVTLRMLDAQGEQLWEAPAADVGGDFSGSSDDRYLRVLGDVVLVHTAPHVVTALDAATGEELWTIDETADETQPLWLNSAVAVDGKLFLPGTDREYMVDARTGERSGELATAMADAHVEDISAVGEDSLLVTTREYGSVILQRR